MILVVLIREIVIVFSCEVELIFKDESIFVGLIVLYIFVIKVGKCVVIKVSW